MKLSTNMSTLDRVLRALLALTVIVLYFTGTISSTIAIVLLIGAGIFLATSFISFCPIYAVCNIRTNRKK